jgi:AbrB family looped-hinge helix DNA binding protein
MKKVKKDEEGYYFGTAKVGEKGQIVVPKEARNLFDIQPGDTVVMVGDSAKGLYIVKSSAIKEFALETLSKVGVIKDKTN